MGVSVLVEWPGSTERQQGDHPGFHNDDCFWANWMVEVIQSPKAVQLLKSLGAGVLLYHNTTNLPHKKIGWARPEEFETAALSMRDLIAAGDARVKPLIDIYRKEWDAAIGDEEGETPEKWFIQDLEDVAAIARYAQSQGAEMMTLGYYW